MDAAWASGQFSEANGELTGSALVTSPGTVTRFVADLNSAVAGTAACIGSQSVELLLGTGRAQRSVGDVGGADLKSQAEGLDRFGVCCRDVVADA
jgi:hypothetical protein